MRHHGNPPLNPFGGNTWRGAARRGAAHAASSSAPHKAGGDAILFFFD